MTIDNQTTLETLISLGFVSEAQLQKWNKRAAREEAEADLRHPLTGRLLPHRRITSPTSDDAGCL